MNFEKAKELIYFFPVYLLMIASINLLSFWQSFEIDIFQYISASEIITKSFYYLFHTLIFTLVGFTIVWLEKRTNDALPPGGGATSPLAMYVRNNLTDILLFSLIFLTIFLFVVKNPLKWQLAIFVVGIPIGTALTHLDFFIEIFPNPRVRARVLPLLAIIPFIVFSDGKISAYKILCGKSKAVSVRFTNEVTSQDFNLLGFSGGFYFFYDIQLKKTLVISERKIDRIEVTTL
jgi:hypothetical protein